MKFLADENFHGDMLRGIMLAFPELDIVRVQDTAFVGTDDASLLEEAARQNAVLITHDVRTMTKFAYERVRAGLKMSGVIEVASDTTIGQAIAELSVMIGAGNPEDFENQVLYVPMQ